MTREDIQRMIGGYATGTLSAAERKALFDAALNDQELFDELAAEQPLKDLLEFPGARERLLQTLAPRHRSWYARPWPWASAVALAAAAVVVVVAVRSVPPDLIPLTPQEIARRVPRPPSAPPLAPQVALPAPAPAPEASAPAIAAAGKTVAAPLVRAKAAPDQALDKEQARAFRAPSIRAQVAPPRASSGAMGGGGGAIGAINIPMTAPGALAMQYRLDTGGQLHVWARSAGYLRVLGATGDFSETLYPLAGDGAMTTGQQADITVHGATLLVDFFKSPPPAVIPGIAGDLHVKDSESAVRTGFIQDPKPTPGSVLIVRIKRY